VRLHRLQEHAERNGLCGLITPLDSGDPFAALLAGNLLAPHPPALPSRIPGGTLIAWSGSLAEGGAESLFARDPATWMPAGLDAFRAALETLEPHLNGVGARLLFRPHARHVLADPQRCLTHLRKWRAAGAPFGLLLDPGAMLEADMLPAAADHLHRAFDALAPLADAILLGNVEPPIDSTPASDDSDAPPPLRQTPLHRGVLDPGLLIALTREFAPTSTPIVLHDAEIDAQRALLGV